MENTSGGGKRAELPEGIKGWSWGAFLLNWIWGIGNSTYIALLVFVPFVNIVMMVVLGVKGREWAWRNRMWTDVDHFNKVQRCWSKAGVVVLILSILVLPVLLFSAVISTFTMPYTSGVYASSQEVIKTNESALEYLGSPISAAFPIRGKYKFRNGGSWARVEYAVSGKHAEANAIVYVTKENDEWVMEKLVITDSDDDVVVNVLGDKDATMLIDEESDK